MRYLALGDSFTIGTGTTPDRSFPAMLVSAWSEAGIECDLRNPAVNGYTTDDLIREELPLVGAFSPDLVTVLIGANDIVAALRERTLQSAAEDRYRRQLRRIYERIRADAPAARVVGLPQPDWSITPGGSAFGAPSDLATIIERFNEIARQECERAGGTYIDIFPLMREQMRTGMIAPDGLHPSAAAYRQWACALKPDLLPRSSA